jgi:hypothetical protein
MGGSPFSFSPPYIAPILRRKLPYVPKTLRRRKEEGDEGNMVERPRGDGFREEQGDDDDG